LRRPVFWKKDLEHARVEGERKKGEKAVRTAVSELELFEPRSLEEALRMLRDEGPLLPIAGCTDVYVGLHFGTIKARRFLDLSGLSELRGIRAGRGGLVIGALATYADAIRSRALRKQLPMLVFAARQIGGPQIQNRGTIAGNVANGSPAGDSLPVLAAADAVLLLRSARAERRVAFNSFYTGYRQSVLCPDELIVAIEVPPVEGRQWFRKVGTRAANAISKVVFAGVRAGRPKIALGSVAPTVVRARRTEEALAAGAPVEEAQRVLQEEIQPIDDFRSTANYRRRVAANLLAQFWGETA
jgi:CO/xanthine dehydrogenase FAD-binding subunit